jgi:hypothetical protein
LFRKVVPNGQAGLTAADDYGLESLETAGARHGYPSTPTESGSFATERNPYRSKLSVTRAHSHRENHPTLPGGDMVGFTHDRAPLDVCARPEQELETGRLTACEVA